MHETLKRVQAGKASTTTKKLVNVGRPTPAELRDMPLPTKADIALASGDDTTTDDEDTSTPWKRGSLGAYDLCEHAGELGVRVIHRKITTGTGL